MITLSDLTLTKPAYIDGDAYHAHATDKAGNEYMVTWEILVDNIESLEDESDACDWEQPIFITKL